MEFIDLAKQQRLIKNNIDTNIQKVLSHGNFVAGPEIKELENRLAQFSGSKHAIACSSGTDALLIALMAFDIGPGDAIFTTPFTFIATAEVISLLGATPIFVDIDAKTFNINAAELEKAIIAVKSNDSSIYPIPGTVDRIPLTCKGIISVDLFGLPAEYDRISKIALENNLFVIEDAAQSFGSEYKGKKACSLADIGCTSFFPAKPLGCYGDGGMCFTDVDEIETSLRSIIVHGKGEHKYENIRIGINGRLDTLQAAILHAKFDIFDKEIELRNKVAERYTKLLTWDTSLLPPYIPEGFKSIWAQYSVLAKNEKHRVELMDKLKTEGIPAVIYYPKPLHLQKAFEFLGYDTNDFPVSEDISKRIFSLPMHPYLTDEEQQKIIRTIKDV